MVLKLFRSRERDHQADIDRMSPVLAAIAAAVASAQRERDGLAARYQREVERASMKSDSAMQFDPAAGSQEGELRTLEKSIAAGAARIRALDAEIARLAKADALLRATDGNSQQLAT